MSEHPVWLVGNRNPSITETITVNGAPVDLSSSTVVFKMRADGSSTLKVNAAAVIVAPATSGVVRYDWAALDVDTAGRFLCWWEVTTAGKTQDVPEALIEFRAHAAQTNAYLELEAVKATLELASSHSDLDILSAIGAASRVVDEITETRFYTTANNEVRYYTPGWSDLLYIDDVNTLAELATDDSGLSTFGTVWTQNTDFVLEPLNAAVDGRPWRRIRRTAQGSKYFRGYPRSVRVTGKFGWAAPPEGVRQATMMILSKAVVRTRQAPMGIVTAFDGTAVRMSRWDPQIEEMLLPYNVSAPIG